MFLPPDFWVLYGPRSGLRLLAAGQSQAAAPVDINAVALRAFDPANNWLQIEASPGRAGTHTPSDANQVFRSVFDAANNALRVTCLSDCGSNFGADISSMQKVGFNAIPLSPAAPSNGQIFQYSSSLNPSTPANVATQSALSSVGTVTSVGLVAPPEFSVSGSPVTSSGNLTLAKVGQYANRFYAGPSTGAVAAPAFRPIVPADLPIATTTSAGTVQLSRDLGGSGFAPFVAGIQGKPVASTAPAVNQVLTWNGSAWVPATPSSSGGGSVTSIGLSMPSQFAVAGSPVTSSGTLSATWNNDNANTLLAGPSSGSAAAPTFRSLVPADLPAATGTAEGAIRLSQDLAGTAGAPTVAGLQGKPVSSTAPSTNQVLFWNGSQWTPAQPSFSNLSGTAAPGQLPAATATTAGAVQLTGDLGGTSSAPRVTWLQGYALAPTAPTANQVLAWNGSAWAPANAPATGAQIAQDLGGTTAAPKVVGLEGNPVSSTTPTSSNQFLGWNGTQWAPAQPSFTNLGGTATAGQIPNLPESQITNLSSDLATKEATANKNQANGYAGLNASSQIAASQMPLFGASGASHVAGAVPDPGSTAGATRYLREDQTWAVPAGGGGGAPGGANTAIQFNSSGTLGGDATNFSYDPVSHNLSVTGQIAAGSFVSTGTGAGYTQWTSGSFSGSAGTVTCGANPGSQFACSDNNGAITPMAMISGDLGGAQGTEQVAGLHLLNEGQLGNQALSTTVPNDGTTGTAQNLLAKIGSAGAALKAAVTDTGVPVYMVASPTATGGNARLVIGGQGTCIFDAALTTSSLGHYVQASTTTAGDCHDAGSTLPSGGWTLGQITAVNGTSGTIQLLQGELPGAGGTGSGTTSSVGLSAPTGFSVTSSPVTTSGTLAFSMPSGWTSGDLLVGNGSNSVARLGVGASGQCLTSNGATAAWGSCGSGGGGGIGGTGSTGQIAVWSGTLAVTGSSGLASDSSGNLTATSTSTKGNPVFSATAYGCAGDGATDNSTCFSSLLTAMGTAGGKIYFGPAASSYNFGSARTISTNNVTVECAPGVVLKQTTTAGLLSLTGSNDSVLNCTLDHASQNGAPLISASGNFAVIDGVVLQNAGVTSPSAAAIDITGGQGSKVLNVSSTSIADRCIGVIPAASTAVREVLISGNVFTFNPGTASLACIYINDGATGSSFVGIQVVHNTVYVGGNNAHAYNLQGASISPNSASQSNQFIGNRCIGMAQFSDCYKMYAFYRSVFAGNLADDANFVSSVALFNFGDAYWTSITGNVARNRAGQGGMSIVDAQGDAVVGNEIDGVGNNFVGIGGNSQSALFSDNIFSGNVVNLTSGKAGICYRVMANSTTFVANDNALVGNHCVGTGTASQIGISIYTNTTTALAPVNTTVRDNQVINVPTGILIDGVSGSTKPVRTTVTPEAFDMVTTQVIDNGTGSLIETHFVTGTATLASGRATVTLSGMDVFSSGTSYLCQAADTTTPANAVTVSAYTSGASFTLAGTGTDVVRYSCRGY